MAFARIFQLRMRGTLHGSETINVYHFGTNENAADLSAVVALMDILATAFITCAIQMLIPAVSQDWTLEGVDVKQIWPELTDPLEKPAPAATIGGRQAVNTSFESVLIRVKTGLGGKRNRGRNFMPPPGDADMTQSLLNNAGADVFFQEWIECIAQAFIGNLATTDFRLGVLSRKAIKDGANPPDAFAECQVLQVENRIKSCNSRKLGRGA